MILLQLNQNEYTWTIRKLHFKPLFLSVLFFPGHLSTLNVPVCCRDTRQHTVLICYCPHLMKPYQL